jgi:Uma2 family endonuclease
MNAILDTRTRHLLTVDALEVLYREGILAPDERVELIEGEIFDMPPSGPPHNGLVNAITKLLVRAAGDDAIVQCQGTVRLGDRSLVMPDFALLRPGPDYNAALPGPADVLLLIEVADSSASFDRNTKAQLYARHGVGEYWLIDINRRTVERYSEASEAGYRVRHEAYPGDRISPLAWPSLLIEVSSLLPA